MKSSAKTVDAYLQELTPERRELVEAISDAIAGGLPVGFEERMIYGMIGWVVPRETYPAGYHCDPALPLPFINLGNQKGSVNLYHMGLYAMPALLEWFQSAWGSLLAELAARVPVDDWITVYESEIRR